jgi:HD-GYP domain-containing protein (c-di-GMP phosphodiesterase class II)
MQEHPALGLELLRPITLWEDILPIIHAHHERWDGKGYPRGLKAEDIPLGARVVAVADAFDAMTRNTPHGKERSADQALAELEAFSATQFDARIVRLFIAEYREHGDPRTAR